MQKPIRKIAAFLAAVLRGTPRRRLALANIAEGTHEGVVTRKTDAAVTTRNLLGKNGSDAAHVAAAGANDLPIGVITDEAADAEESVAVALLGVSKRTLLLVAVEAISAGAPVYTAANGKVQDLPAGAGTYYEVGLALSAATADGDLIEVATCVARKTVVA